MKILRCGLGMLAGVWVWLFISCSTAEYASHNIYGKAYGTTANEASQAQVIFSLAEVNLAIARGVLGVDEGLDYLRALEATTYGAQREQVQVSIEALKKLQPPGSPVKKKHSAEYERWLKLYQRY